MTPFRTKAILPRALWALCISIATLWPCPNDATAQSPHQRDFFVMDAARIIEGLDITDRDRQRVILTLLEDYDRDWSTAHGRLVEGQRRALEISTPEYRAALANWTQAFEEKQQAQTLYKEIRGAKIPSERAIEEARLRRAAATKALEQASRAMAATDRMDPATAASADTQMRIDRATLAQHLEDCLELILTEEELQKWPDMRADLDRRRALAKDTIAGEGLHLEDFLKQLSPPLNDAQFAMASPVIKRWRHDVDQRLAARAMAVGDEHLHHDFWNEDTETRRQIVQAIQTRLRTQRAVRDVTYTCLESIAGQLDAGTAQQIRDQYQRTVHRPLFKETLIEHAISALLTAGTTPKETEQLQAILAAHQAWHFAERPLRIEVERSFHGTTVIVNLTQSDRAWAPEAHAAQKAKYQLDEAHAQRILDDWIQVERIVGRTRAKLARGTRRLPKINSSTK